MSKLDKILTLGALGGAALWSGLYFFLISPEWEKRDNQATQARDKLNQWLGFYKVGSGKSPLPEAQAALEQERRSLNQIWGDLRRIEFTRKPAGFLKADAGAEDPNNYFDKKRREISETARKQMGITLAPGLEDLGLRGELTKDSASVSLNLLRLYILKQFFAAAKDAGVTQVAEIRYPKEMAIDPPSDAGVGRLFQVPLELRLRLAERQFAPLLFELQRPTDERRSYFCVRAFSLSVRDAASGMLDATLALGALFPESQYLNECKIPFKEAAGEGGPHSLLPRDPY